ncbi:MAG: hypothetical protein KF878_25140 [Planctomycetes bacterium]|nr:hypothetical protein [Planctomycetota bacterium]
MTQTESICTIDAGVNIMAVVLNAVAEEDGIEDSGDCVHIGDRLESLDKIAKKLGVKPLGDFVSVDASEWLSEEEEEELVPEGEGKAQWFSAKDGLKTVRALMGHLKEKPKVFKSSDKVLEDLLAYETALVLFEKKKTRWRIAVLD